MGTKGAYSITISAVDAATNVFDGINKRIETMNKRATRLAAPFKQLGSSITKFTQVTGLAKIATGFADVARAGQSAFASMLRVIEPLAAITGAASLAGMYKLVTAWGEFGQALSNQASRAGMTADSLFALQKAAQLAGVSADSLTQGMTSLNDNLRNAAFGGAPQFLAVLRNLGVSYEDLQKQSPDERIRTLAEALSKVSNATDRALYATQVFSGAGEAMLPMLSRGADGIDQFRRRAEELTGTFSPEMLQRALDFAKSQRELGLATQGLGNFIAVVLAPAFQPLVDGLRDAVVATRQWVDVNQAWLRGEITTKVGEFVTWLKGLDWTKLGADIKAVGSAALGLVQGISDLSPAAKIAVEVVAGLLLTGLLGPVLTLTAAVLNLVLAVGTSLPAAFKLAQMAAEMFSTRTMALPVFKVIAASMGILDRLQQGISVDSLPADSPFRSLPPPAEVGADRETGRDDRDDNSMGAFLRRHMPGGTGSGAEGAVATVPLTPGQRTENARAMGDVFREAGYTREFTAAMLGSGIQESGLNAHAGAGTAHRGAFQWDAERRAAIEAQFGTPVDQMTPRMSAQAAAWEIDHNDRFADVRRAARSEHDLARANDMVTRRFEGPGHYDVEVPNRLGLSQGALAAMPENPDPNTTAPSPITPARPGGNAATHTSDHAPLPSASSAAGPPPARRTGAPHGRVRGPPATVAAQTFGGAVALNIRGPGLLDTDPRSHGDYSRGY